MGGRYSHSVQLCVPFRMFLRVGVEVEVEVEDADADADVLGEPRTMLETFGWIAHRVNVRGRSDAGRGRVADGRIRPRTKWPSERIEPIHLQLNVVNDRRRNFVVELLMTMSDSKDSRDCR